MIELRTDDPRDGTETSVLPTVEELRGELPSLHDVDPVTRLMDWVHATMEHETKNHSETKGHP